jgi:hypothetical protein
MEMIPETTRTPATLTNLLDQHGSAVSQGQARIKPFSCGTTPSSGVNQKSEEPNHAFRIQASTK